ncbi:MAG: hypothetical protein H6705_08655 [Myxococcales bacterium]|nr:hypothetical protein [Myxococcales bacterium]
MAAADRDEADNLILLCPTHHTLIDKVPEQYPAELLRRWKAEHEAWVEVSSPGRCARSLSWSWRSSPARSPTARSSRRPTSPCSIRAPR